MDSARPRPGIAGLIIALLLTVFAVWLLLSDPFPGLPLTRRRCSAALASTNLERPRTGAVPGHMLRGQFGSRGGTPRDSQIPRFDSISGFGPKIEFSVTFTGDFLLAKLRWYRMAGGKNAQQWHDVTRIVAVQGDHLDRAYLAEWAHELGVADLLARLLSAWTPGRASRRATTRPGAIHVRRRKRLRSPRAGN